MHGLEAVDLCALRKVICKQRSEGGDAPWPVALFVDEATMIRIRVRLD
jgi:hypothetical protein